MATAREIRNQLRQWLDGNTTFRQFEEWFVQAAGAIATENDPEAEALVDDIDMSLSEYSDGVLTATELREELDNAIRPFVRVYGKSVELVIGEPRFEIASATRSQSWEMAAVA